MNIPYGNKEFTDRYYLFKKRQGFEDFIDHKIKPDDEFRACDYVSFATDKYNDSNSSSNTESLTIKTNSMLNFSIDDLVYSIRDGITYRITKTTINDDSVAKRYSNRPRKFTILTLIRGEFDE